MNKTYEEQTRDKKSIVDFYGNIWYNDVAISKEFFIGCFNIVNTKYEVYYAFGDMYVKCRNKICRMTFIDKSNIIAIKAYEVWYENEIRKNRLETDLLLKKKFKKN